MGAQGRSRAFTRTRAISLDLASKHSQALTKSRRRYRGARTPRRVYAVGRSRVDFACVRRGRAHRRSQDVADVRGRCGRSRALTSALEILLAFAEVPKGNQYTSRTLTMDLAGVSCSWALMGAARAPASGVCGISQDLPSALARSRGRSWTRTGTHGRSRSLPGIHGRPRVFLAGTRGRSRAVAISLQRSLDPVGASEVSRALASYSGRSRRRSWTPTSVRGRSHTLPETHRCSRALAKRAGSVGRCY